MKELNKKILNILESNNFKLNDISTQDNRKGGVDYVAEIGQYTPEGEDWYEVIFFNGTDADFIKSIKNRSEYFDIDEEVKPYIEIRGTNGVPNSIKALIEDAEWKKDALIELAEELKNIK